MLAPTELLAGKHLRGIRALYGVTQLALAKGAGMNLGTLVDVEAGRVELTQEEYHRLRALVVRLSEVSRP